MFRGEYRMRTKIVLCVAALAVLGLMTSASAAPRTSPSISFFSTGDSLSQWVKVGGNQLVSLTATATGYAGAELKHVAGAAPANAPTFSFTAPNAPTSGGSPRLVMNFSDGGRIEGRPLDWTVAEQLVGDGDEWDSNGGGECGFVYGVDYNTALECHDGSDVTVTSVFVITDSGWLNGAHTVQIDDIQYGGDTIASARNNGNNGS